MVQILTLLCVFPKHIHCGVSMVMKSYIINISLFTTVFKRDSCLTKNCVSNINLSLGQYYLRFTSFLTADITPDILSPSIQIAEFSLENMIVVIL